MKALKYILLAIGAISIAQLHAQNSIFLQEGKIEFEKKLNVYAQMDEGDSWSDLQRKTMSKFRSTYFDLTFSKNKTIYQPGRENPDNNKNMFYQDGGADENIVYSELDSSKSISLKKFYDQIYLIQDSTRQIQWKITDETRVVAGFNCRRANAIIMDTVYVVAFYTDEIVSPGGPESFNGLPGMILGISLPHQHVTWFATKVSAIPVTAAQLKVPSKGKKITMTALHDAINERLKDFGKFKQKALEAIML